VAKRNVVWTRTADIQLVGVLEYWISRNKTTTYSKKLLKSVVVSTNQIAETPFLFKATDFVDVRVGTFSIFYKVTSTEIIVTAFWDNRQNPQELLKILAKAKDKKH